MVRGDAERRPTRLQVDHFRGGADLRARSHFEKGLAIAGDDLRAFFQVLAHQVEVRVTAACLEDGIGHEAVLLHRPLGGAAQDRCDIVDIIHEAVSQLLGKVRLPAARSRLTESHTMATESGPTKLMSFGLLRLTQLMLELANALLVHAPLFPQIQKLIADLSASALAEACWSCCCSCSHRSWRTAFSS